MTGPALVVLALAAGAVTSGAVALVLGPRRRVGARVAPYRPGSATPSDGASWSLAPVRGTLRALFGPPLRSLAAGGSPSGDDGRMADRLRAAGLDAGAAESMRVRRVVQASAMGAAGLLVGALVLRSAPMMLLLTACGVGVGATRVTARLARLADERRIRMRLELVTVDQLLAMHVRAGAGPVQAVTRVVDRGHGFVIDELRAVCASIRTGRSEAEAFRHAADATTEPHAARTYRLFALAAEHGADLGTALRALSDDLRQVRREELRRQATRRRAAMLVPTIAVLAPIMLLFVIAPLPSIVLGGRP